MKNIILNQNSFAIVDDEDFEFLNQWKWSMDGKGYACHQGMKMHRVITDAPANMFCDHINGNRLDNRKCNIRFVTNKQNIWNQKKKSTNTSGYKGVSFQNGKWHSKITANGKQYHIGYYETKEEAAKAYDEKAKELHGDYARTNF